ncbi:MAG: hypothetical protein ACUVQQ_08075, partial [Thermogutta sp.]
WARRSCSQSHLGSRSFLGREDTHPPLSERDQTYRRGTKIPANSWERMNAIDKLIFADQDYIPRPTRRPTAEGFEPA